MAIVRLTVVWFNETGEYLVREGDASGVNPHDQVICTITADLKHDPLHRELERLFDSCLRMRGLTRASIANLDDVKWLITPPRYD